MTTVDFFESEFRAADKERFQLEPITVRRVLLVTDLPEDRRTKLKGQAKTFLGSISGAADWSVLGKNDFGDIGELLTAVESAKPDLIVTYRHLASNGWRFEHSLGSYLDVLTQATTVPVCVLPHPLAGLSADHSLDNTDRVMAMADHLAGDAGLVNWASAATVDGGHLLLAHIEDERVFQRYADTIGKIPSVDTDSALAGLRERLIKDPEDYVETCRKVLTRARPDIEVVSVIRFGQHLAEYCALVEEHRVDLLVYNTKDQDQLAMHGRAYALAVELRSIPLLLL